MTTQPNKKQAAPGNGPEAEGETDVNHNGQSDYTPSLEDAKAAFANYLKVLSPEMRGRLERFNMTVITEALNSDNPPAGLRTYCLRLRSL